MTNQKLVFSKLYRKPGFACGQFCTYQNQCSFKRVGVIAKFKMAGVKPKVYQLCSFVGGCSCRSFFAEDVLGRKRPVRSE